MINIVSGLANGQVLQRRESGLACVTLRLFCREEGGLHGTITLSGKARKSWKDRRFGKAAKGPISLELNGVPTGGPYRLELSCGLSRASVERFFVGDVWLLAGQSNMEGCGNMDAAASSHPLIQAFSMSRMWRRARDPLHIPRESPDPCHSHGKPYTRKEAAAHRKGAARGVGVGIFFARKMLSISGVPQGLICAAHGGTNMTQWDPAHKTKDFLYGSMLASVRATGQPVAGMLWYQGESDSNPDAHPKYTTRMKKFVASVRRDLKQPFLPWIVCQNARVFGSHKNPACWNSIQDQQRLLSKQIDFLDMVATIDLPMDDHVHIISRGFTVLAERMADVAARMVYRDSSRIPTPSLRGIRLLSSGYSHRLEVRYDNIWTGLRSQGPAQGFTLLDTGKNVLPSIYETSLDGNIVRLHLAEYPPEGISLAYGSGTTPACNITDGRGQALPVFAPQHIHSAEGWLPFVTSWRVSKIVPCSEYSLGAGGAADLADFKTITKHYGPSGFIDEHQSWEKNNGTCFFTCAMNMPRPMRLEASMGYDGPFRLYIDEEPFFTDLKGTNPCIPDKCRKTVKLSAGRHFLRVAMDLNNGLAWGFFLRFRRLGISAARQARQIDLCPEFSP